MPGLSQRDLHSCWFGVVEHDLIENEAEIAVTLSNMGNPDDHVIHLASFHPLALMVELDKNYTVPNDYVFKNGR
jgi:hypothetical protein